MSDREIVDYCLLKAESSDDLSKYVSEAIARGAEWQPFGSAGVSMVNRENVRAYVYTQAIVRYAKA